AVPSLVPSGVQPGAPYLPWLAVVDRVAAWSAGQATDAAAVAAVAADGISDRYALGYDTAAGAPAYAQGSLDDLELDLASFLDASAGRTVNCSDCATLAATYANMVGADYEYAILGWSFYLNDIKAIGATSWTDDPF